MHRHGYQGKKFGRETGPRKALIKGLADSLVLNQSIETTLPKAKELISYTEKLITKAKAGGLHNRRQVLNGLNTIEAAHMLIDDIAPKLGNRTSGHLRIKRTTLRRGDNTQMARISFVDDLKVKAPAKPAEVAKKATAKPVAKKTLAKKPVKPVAKPKAKKEVK